ncbi:hypothetical protein [Oceaniglobus trochenteri]|uniref:hypothetical protein n=1 Tax=Oceaniglobus trochenteri TaxID=2763260 RepID=UPI001CFF85E8|nr:hypothetical protein [Oceaniglobus trochenteri]
MNREGLERLARLAEMKRDLDLQELSRISAQMNAIQGDIDRLRHQLRRRGESTDMDLARRNGVDLAWQRWAETRIAAYQQRMAELALAREQFLDRARLSFGRAGVLGKLEQRKK